MFLYSVGDMIWSAVGILMAGLVLAGRWCLSVAQPVVRTVLCILNICYAVGSYLWWTNILRPLCWIAPELYQVIEGTLYKWQQENVAYWLWTAGYTGLLYALQHIKIFNRMLVFWWLVA